jgi:hypothetical protein
VVERGLLVKGGYWHQALSKGFAWKKGTTLFLWTGHLVRPAPGVWLLVSRAFNRHCLVNLAEYVMTDDEAFIPVILHVDLSSLRGKNTWLDTELACLTPLRPHVGFTRRSLRQQPEVGRAFCAFYDASYLEPRAEGEYLGRYRKITARQLVTAASGKAECQLVIFGGPNLHQIGTFDRFATAVGHMRNHPAKRLLQFGVVRNICDVKGRWDGSSVRDISADMPEEAQRLREHWATLYGPEKVPSIDWLTEYAHDIHGPQRGEPYLPITPWLFVVTPPGWSSIIDSCHFEGLDGMRGVISTDTYFGVPPQWQVTRPGRFAIHRGALLARVLPVPRHLLQATFRRLSITGEVLNA